MAPGGARCGLLAASVIICCVPGLIAVFASTPELTGGDAPEYHQIALNLVQHEIFSKNHEPPYQPTFFRAPGYPLFLAGIYAVTSGSIQAVQIAQLTLFWLSTWTVWWIASKLLSRRVAFLAAGLTLVYLPLISFVSWRLTEILASFLLASALALFLRIIYDVSRLSSFVLCGIALALLTLVKPSYTLLFVGLLPVFPWKTKPQRLFRNVAYLILAFALPVACWIIRNSLLARQPVGLTSSSGVVLYESALQYADKITYKKASAEWAALIDEEHAREEEVRKSVTGFSSVPLQLRYEMATDREFKAAAAQVFRENRIPHPLTNLAKRLAYLWFPPSDYFEPRLHTVARIQHFGLVVFMAFGCYCLRKRGDVLLLLLMPAIYTSLLHLVFQVEGRYSIPARLPLIIIAAYGMGRALRLRRTPMKDIRQSMRSLRSAASRRLASPHVSLVSFFAHLR